MEPLEARENRGLAKTCNTCGVEKPLTEFYKNRRMKDGHLNQCKACRAELHKQTHKRIHELTPQELKKRRGYRQKYYRSTKEAFAERQRRNLAAQRNAVYSIRNVFSGKEYIGSTTTYRHRMSGHKSKLRLGRHSCKELQKDYDLEGMAAFEFKILYEMTNEDFSVSILREKEKEIIQSISTAGGTLYNETFVPKDWSGGKVCPSCGEHKSRRDFYLSKRTNSGLSTYCIKCRHNQYIKQKEKSNAKR